MTLTAKEQLRSDEIYEDLISGSPDNTHMEDLWREIESMMSFGVAYRRQHMDAIEDMTLADVCRKVADARAKAWGGE